MTSDAMPRPAAWRTEPCLAPRPSSKARLRAAAVQGRTRHKRPAPPRPAPPPSRSSSSCGLRGRRAAPPLLRRASLLAAAAARPGSHCRCVGRLPDWLLGHLVARNAVSQPPSPLSTSAPARLAPRPSTDAPIPNLPACPPCDATQPQTGGSGPGPLQQRGAGPGPRRL